MKKLKCYLHVLCVFVLLFLTTISFGSTCRLVYGPPVPHPISYTPPPITGITVGPGQYEAYFKATSAPSAGLVINGDVIVDGGVLDINLDGIEINGNIYVKNCGILNIHHTTSSGNCTFNGAKIYVLPSAKMNITNMFMYMHTNTAIAIESDYILGSGGIPRTGGILQLENVVFQTQGHTGWWYGISVAGGNGESTGTKYAGITKSQYYSQNKLPFTSDIYVGQLLAHYVLCEGMLYGITNFDKYGDNTVGNYGDLFGQYSGGGLIQFKNSTFRGNYNNVMSFYNYKNWQPKTSTNITFTTANTLIKDKSFIRETGFSNIYYAGVYTNRFIDLYQTDGVSILGCEFIDQGTFVGPNVAAIEGNESNVTITSSCNDPFISSTPYGCTHLKNTLFADMRKYGIELNSSTGSYITQNIFAGSYGMRGVGIDMHDCLHDVILNNDVTTSFNTGISAATVVGIAMEGCKSFWLEGNLVHRATPGPTGQEMFGIVVNNTGGSSDIVYRNTVKFMDYQMQANGANYSIHHGMFGLRYICNDMHEYGSNNSTDILVGDIMHSGVSGIDPLQAIPITGGFISSGNTFATTKYTPGYNLYNPVANPAIEYYWSTSDEEPTLKNNVNATFTPNTKTCPNNTICCSVSDPFSTSVIPTTGYTGYTSYLIKKAVLESIIDTADTAGTLYQYSMRQYSMLVDTMVRTYLYAADSMMQFKGDSFFMEYKIDTLHDTVNQAYYYDTTVRYADISVPLNFDSVMMVLDSARYFHEFKLRLAAMYKHNNDFTNAIATLNQILSNYTLSDYDVRDINNTIYLYSIEDTLINNNNSFDSLSSTDTALIGSIARDSIGNARYQAQGILSRYDTTYFWPDVTILEDTTGSKGAMPYTATTENLNIQLSPNPVRDILNISLNKYGDDMQVVITDINGKRMLMQIVNGNGNTVISTSGFHNGIYFVKVLNGNKVEKVFKIIKN